MGVDNVSIHMAALPMILPCIFRPVRIGDFE